MKAWDFFLFFSLSQLLPAKLASVEKNNELQGVGNELLFLFLFPTTVSFHAGVLSIHEVTYLVDYNYAI